MPSWKTLGLAGGTAGRAGDVDVGGTSNRGKSAACGWSRSTSRSSHHRRRSYQTTTTCSSAYFTFTSTSKATALGHPSPSLPQSTHPPPLVQGVAILHHLCFHPASPYACFPLPLPLTRFTLLHCFILPTAALLCSNLLHAPSVSRSGYVELLLQTL
jgi:hypothetical protein